MAQSYPRVGFARVRVTEAGRLGTMRAHDDLFARVLYTATNDGPVLLVSLDHMGLTPGRRAAVTARLAKASGIPPDRIAVCHTHTHAGVDFRAGELSRLLAGAAGRARQGARPAELAYLRVDVNRRYSVNRRAIVGQGLGAVSIIFNRNVTVDLRKHTEECGEQIRDFIRTGRNIWSPRYLEPEFDPAAPARLSERQLALLAHLPERVYLDGPVDPHLEWLCFRTQEGGWLGSIVRFSAHPVIWRKSITKMVSADYPGVFAARVEEETSAPALFVNGPCGDVKPLYRVNGEAEMERVGESLARELMSRCSHLRWSQLERVGFAGRRETFPVHADVRRYAGRWPIEAAAARHAAIGRRGEDPVAAKRALDWALRVWGNGTINWRRQAITMPFSLLTFNDVGLLGLPTEVWCEIGLSIKRACSEKKLIVGANCDISTNYVPPPGQLALGGYEAVNSMLEESAAERFVAVGAELANANM